MSLLSCARKVSKLTVELVSTTIGPGGLLILLLAVAPVLQAHAADSPPLKIAVFDFELEDASAAGKWSTSDTANDAVRMKAVNEEAR